MSGHDSAIDPVVTRRRLVGLAGAGFASALLPACSARPREVSAAEPPPASLRVAEDATAVSLVGVPRESGTQTVEDAVRRAALAATDFSWLSRGDSVLIKPVSNSGNDYPATTDPRALYAMIRLLKERGAGRVVVGEMSGVQFVRFSKDRTSGSSRALMTRNGLARAALDAGAELHLFEEAGWDAFFAERPEASESWSAPILMPEILNEMDHVVLMPRCARHLLAGSTLGLKAAVGWWRHDSRLLYHNKAANFSQKTAEANATPTLLRKQRLVLTSATRVLSTFGPDDGHVTTPDTGLIVASESILAHDMTSLAWLLENRDGLAPHLYDGVLDDPNQFQSAVNFANRVVNYFLGGFGAAVSAESLPRYDVAAVWDDRVLRPGAAAFGGAPRVEFVDAGSMPIPAPILGGLERRIALPG